jgi:hypothetical protein
VERARDRRLRKTVRSGTRADIRRFSALLATAVTVAVVLTGCGGSGNSQTDTTRSNSSPPRPVSGVNKTRYVERAEAICRQSVRETHTLGQELSQTASHSTSIQDTIARGLVKPGIGILSRQASRLRGLRPIPSSRDLYVYLGLFDPIIELSRQLLQAGETGNTAQSHNLELMIAGLGNEQSAAARHFGFRTCSVGFTSALGGAG